MVKIAICDDDSSMLILLENQLVKILNDFGVQGIVETYTSSAELIDSYKRNIFDLIITDIIMPEKNGIETATELRSCGYEGDIVFMTSNTEYALDAYDAYPLSFLPKPFTYEKLSDVMKKFFSRHSGHISIVIPNNSGAKESVSVDDILYIESQGHSVCYALENGSVYTVTGNFTKTISCLPEYFFRCHRCYAINMKKAKSIQRYYFIVGNNTQIPISKGEFKEAARRFVYTS